MIENFLRRPSTVGEVLADALRVAGFLSAIVAAIFFSATDAGVVAFTLPALVAPRFMGVPALFDTTFCVIVLVAAWSNVLDLYRSIAVWDIVMHVVCTAVLAPMLYEFLARFGIVRGLGRGSSESPRRREIIVHFTMIGLALSALWEMVEWVGFVWITEEIHVEYHDTIGDMAAGGLGALAAGILVAAARGRVRRGAR